MAEIDSYVNQYINAYINNFVRAFRNFVTSKYIVNIEGLANFFAVDDHDVNFLLDNLQTYGFTVKISNGQDTIDEIQVEYSCEECVKKSAFEYRIENLISTIYLSSKTGISIVGILIMQIISQIICKSKTMYKAIILDLDDTVWKGTLAEDGIEAIKQGLHSSDATPFITFMCFIQAIAKELGVYVAICSRNESEKVLSAIHELNEKEFPIKGQIDCVVANYNDKSENIRTIAQQLSILTNACVFIDDNHLVRDEVRLNLPEVFVPDWNSLDELITLLMVCCVFERNELSLKYRNRKREYKILQQARIGNYRPNLFVKICDDTNHIEAMRLYAKSNQFRFSEKKESYEECKSIVFEMYRDNGENLGICSAVTYMENNQNLYILNWAISCRYFEIGLEEYILMYLLGLSNRRPMIFTFNNSGFNGRVVALIEKYKNDFKKNNCDGKLYFTPNDQSIGNIKNNTNLKEYCNE